MELGNKKNQPDVAIIIVDNMHDVTNLNQLSSRKKCRIRTIVYDEIKIKIHFKTPLKIKELRGNVFILPFKISALTNILQIIDNAIIA